MGYSVLVILFCFRYSEVALNSKKVFFFEIGLLIRKRSSYLKKEVFLLFCLVALIDPATFQSVSLAFFLYSKTIEMIQLNAFHSPTVR